MRDGFIATRDRRAIHVPSRHPPFLRATKRTVANVSAHRTLPIRVLVNLQHVFPCPPSSYMQSPQNFPASTYTCYTSCACPAFSVDTGGNTRLWWRHTIAGLGCRSRTRTVPIPIADRRVSPRALGCRSLRYTPVPRDCFWNPHHRSTRFRWRECPALFHRARATTSVVWTARFPSVF